VRVGRGFRNLSYLRDVWSVDNYEDSTNTQDEVRHHVQEIHSHRAVGTVLDRHGLREVAAGQAQGRAGDPRRGF